MDLNHAPLARLVKIVGVTCAYDLRLGRPYLDWREVADVPGVGIAGVRELQAHGLDLPAWRFDPKRLPGWIAAPWNEAES